MSPKSSLGRFFEDFAIDEEIVHAIPRTVTDADAVLYTALTGNRWAATTSVPVARGMGHRAVPLDDFLVFHLVFGKSVPDVSLNAIANLGYAGCRFLQPVYPGETIGARSRVIGLKENADGKTGIVYVHTVGLADGEPVLEFRRWVMVRRRTEGSGVVTTRVPELPSLVTPQQFVVPDWLKPGAVSPSVTGSHAYFEDYTVGERVDHLDGITVDEAEHMMATRHYHNNARVHFDTFAARGTRFGRRIIYGGHVISICRGLAMNGFANGQSVLAINGGRHVAPTFAEDTLYAWTQVLETLDIPGRQDSGALRLRLVGVKNHSTHEFPDTGPDGKPHPSVVLDLDYTVLMPRRPIGTARPD